MPSPTAPPTYRRSPPYQPPPTNATLASCSSRSFLFTGINPRRHPATPANPSRTRQRHNLPSLPPQSQIQARKDSPPYGFVSPPSVSPHAAQPLRHRHQPSGQCDSFPENPFPDLSIPPDQHLLLLRRLPPVVLPSVSVQSSNSSPSAVETVAPFLPVSSTADTPKQIDNRSNDLSSATTNRFFPDYSQVSAQVCKDACELTWIDDSKSTNIGATYMALETLKAHKLVILLGGVSKVFSTDGTSGFIELVEILNNHRGVVTFGYSSEVIRKELLDGSLSIPCISTVTLADAVTEARKIAQKGDTILLSPGCSSFDEFENFEHRGNTFQQLAHSAS